MRIERPHTIGVADAVAEDVVSMADGLDPVRAYRSVREGVNGAESRTVNPWVTVMTRRRIIDPANSTEI